MYARIHTGDVTAAASQNIDHKAVWNVVPYLFFTAFTFCSVQYASPTGGKPSNARCVSLKLHTKLSNCPAQFRSLFGCGHSYLPQRQRV
jgi:hypothetical protein